jgi:N-methylhydantoinase B
MAVTSGVDVFTAEIVRNAIASAAREMNQTLRRTAHNPLLYDVQDFGLGIISPEGQLWGEAQGQSVFIGALSETIKTGTAKRGVDGFREGDVLIVNDPFLTGTHISDTSVYVPIFFEGELVAFAEACAHWADIGGKAPGGWCPDSTDVYQEGICFNHQRLYTAGVPNEDLLELITMNVRFPSLVRGDLDAMIACCHVGEARMQALCRKVGVETVQAAMEMTIARTDEAVRRQIEALPDGTWSAGIAMDYDGVVKGEHPRIEVQVTIEGDRIKVGFDGTSPATRGPINVTALGARSGVRVALKALLAPHDRTNEGHFMAVDFDLPPGLIVSAERPSPTDSYGYVITCVEEMIFAALADALPERCPAGGYALTGAFLSRVDPRTGSPFILIDGVGGGNGAQPAADGPTMMMFPNGDVPNQPVEVLETRYPALRVERFALRTEAAGAGKYRGGMGVIREYRVLGPGMTLQTNIENTYDELGKGLNGGGTGSVGEIVVWPGTEQEIQLVDRVTGFGPFEVNDVISVRTPGGGGWGSPLERDPQQVASDVRNELISREQATTTYSVALHDDLTVDDAKTERLRATPSSAAKSGRQ